MSVAGDVLAAIQSGSVPANISAEYLSESRDAPAQIAIHVVGTVTAFVVIVRCICRAVVRKFGADDLLALASMLFQLSFVVLSLILINLGTGRHLEYLRYVLSASDLGNTETFDFAAHLIYTTALVTARLSGLAFYHRLGELHDRLQLAIRIAAAVLITIYIPQMFLIIFHCRPVTSLWPYSFQAGFDDHTCLDWGVVYLTNSCLSIFCDFFMFGIPLALIHSLQMQWKRKVRLYMVLAPGLLVILVSISRLWLVIKSQYSPDGSWYYDPLLAVENSEVGGTLIALSIPGLKPILSYMLGRTNKSYRSTPVTPTAVTQVRTGESARSATDRLSKDLAPLNAICQTPSPKSPYSPLLPKAPTVQKAPTLPTSPTVSRCTSAPYPPQSPISPVSPLSSSRTGHTRSGSWRTGHTRNGSWRTNHTRDESWLHVEGREALNNIDLEAGGQRAPNIILEEQQRPRQVSEQISLASNHDWPLRSTQV